MYFYCQRAEKNHYYIHTTRKKEDLSNWTKEQSNCHSIDNMGTEGLTGKILGHSNYNGRRRLISHATHQLDQRTLLLRWQHWHFHASYVLFWEKKSIWKDNFQVTIKTKRAAVKETYSPRWCSLLNLFSTMKWEKIGKLYFSWLTNMRSDVIFSLTSILSLSLNCKQ